MSSGAHETDIKFTYETRDIAVSQLRNSWCDKERVRIEEMFVYLT